MYKQSIIKIYIGASRFPNTKGGSTTTNEYQRAKTKVALLAFNHHNKYDFTLSNN